ncbi:alginate lyase family protein [Roseibium sp. Sym1]|uniref:alginate lyase family protein n=1 Tax=Roseibium sp. Sym1 TaxID=3016006 RepID=UPI0022B5853D|nr:alginate lyase family protein [Roseibium sp. Sym1]
MTLKSMKLMMFSIVVALMGSSASASGFSVPFPLARSVEDNNGKTSCSEKLPQPVRTLELGSIYSSADESRSTIDPDNKRRYQAAIKDTRAYLSFVTKNASNYTQTDGNRLDDAACALAALDLWARADALSDLKTRQSFLSMTRIIAGSAVAYMQVRPAVRLLDFDTAEIDKWLVRLAEATIPVYTESGDRRSNRQNHRYWGGFAVAAVGVAVGRKDLLEFGYDSYKLGVCQVTADGALPLELDRRKKARDYHLHALAPLLMLASLTEANGYEAYSLCGNALRRLVRFSLDSIADPSRMEELSGERQVKLPREENGLIRGDRIAWLEVYLMKYPEDRAKYGGLYVDPLYSSSLGGRISAVYNIDFRN